MTAWSLNNKHRNTANYDQTLLQLRAFGAIMLFIPHELVAASQWEWQNATVKAICHQSNIEFYGRILFIVPIATATSFSPSLVIAKTLHSQTAWFLPDDKTNASA